MTIEQYAAQQGQTKVIRYTLDSGLHVYLLTDEKAGDAVVGFPIFAVETADGWRLTTIKERLKIMKEIYGTNE